MNKFSNLFTTALFVSLAIFVSCGGGSDDPEPPSAQAVQAALLTNPTFTLTSATLDGTDAGWSGVTLTASGDETGGTLTMTGSPDQTVWPSTTTWVFTDATTTTSVTRGDGVVMTISLSDTAGSFSYEISTAGARVAGIDGAWVIRFAVQ